MCMEPPASVILMRWVRITLRPRQSMNLHAGHVEEDVALRAELGQGGLQREHRVGVDFAGDDDHSDAIRVSDLDT